MMVHPSRVSYQVTATVEPQLVDEFERFMVEDHMPALIATGCFGSAAIVRVGPGRYRMRYEAESRAELDRYLQTEAPRVRSEFTARFPSGIALEREVGEVLGEWGE
jgi:Ni,Fe-hydrogenase III component G